MNFGQQPEGKRNPGIRPGRDRRRRSATPTGICGVRRSCWRSQTSTDAEDFVEDNLWEAMKRIPLHEPDRRTSSAPRVLEAQRMVRDTIYCDRPFHGDGTYGTSWATPTSMWSSCGPTRSSSARSGARMPRCLRLMEQYPEFHFCQSQAKIYADMKKYYPDLFEQVKAARRRGALGTDRRLLGGTGLQPDLRRIVCAPDPPRAALLPGELRHDQPHLLAAGRLRAELGHAADPGQQRH